MTTPSLAESVSEVDPVIAFLIRAGFFATVIAVSVGGPLLFMRTQWYKDNMKS